MPAFLLACLAYLGVALPGSTLGLLWPSIRLSLGQPVGALGILLVRGIAASVISSAVTGRLRVPAGPLVVGAALLIALAAGGGLGRRRRRAPGGPGPAPRGRRPAGPGPVAARPRPGHGRPVRVHPPSLTTVIPAGVRPSIAARARPTSSSPITSPTSRPGRSVPSAISASMAG